MSEKLYKIVDGFRIELTEDEIQEYNSKQNVNIDLEKLKQNKTKELKCNCSQYIYSLYPQFKQSNIIVGINSSEQNLIDMKTFIQSQINTCSNKEIQINNCLNTSELNSIDIEY